MVAGSVHAVTPKLYLPRRPGGRRGYGFPAEPGFSFGFFRPIQNRSTPCCATPGQKAPWSYHSANAVLGAQLVAVTDEALMPHEL